MGDSIFKKGATQLGYLLYFSALFLCIIPVPCPLLCGQVTVLLMKCLVNVLLM